MASQLTTTKLIWHNGEFIPWESATIHVMSHVVHYGSSVFEGIRCYDTPDGPAIFRLPEHLRRMRDSARIYRMDYPQLRHCRREPRRLSGGDLSHLLALGRVPRRGRTRARRGRLRLVLAAPRAQHLPRPGEGGRQLPQLADLGSPLAISIPGVPGSMTGAKAAVSSSEIGASSRTAWRALWAATAF